MTGRHQRWCPLSDSGHDHRATLLKSYLQKRDKRQAAAGGGVQKIGPDKNYWTDIGAAWAHQDGKGFAVKLDYLPLAGAEIVIREPRTEGGRS